MLRVTLEVVASAEAQDRAESIVSYTPWGRTPMRQRAPQRNPPKTRGTAPRVRLEPLKSAASNSQLQSDHPDVHPPSLGRVEGK